MPIPQNQPAWPGPGDTRSRVWTAAVQGPGMPVVVRRVAVLNPGEDLSEYPETWELTYAEWTADVGGQPAHKATYGLTADGRRLADDTTERAAWRKLRRVAAGTDPIDAQTIAAVLQLFKYLRGELT